MINHRLHHKDKVALEKRHWVRLTRACNNRCIFCLDSENQDGSFLSFSQIEKDLKKGRREKIRRAILSGGEPTIHPDFLKIVKRASNLKYNNIQIITNGRMFAYQDFLEKTVKAGVNEITFSIHGHNKRLYEKQSQVKNSFEQALRGLLNALRYPNLIVNIDVVINKLNYRHLFDILSFFISLGVSEFDLLQVMPFGRAWENRDKVFYDIEKALPYLRRAFALSENPHLFIWTNRFPPRYLEGFEDLIQHPIKIIDEVRGREQIFKSFLEKETLMSCYGERCQYCSLENFCQDLIEFQKKKVLFSKKMPECLSNKEKVSLCKKINLSKSGNNLYKFANFYINHRYLVKSLRCKKCRFNKNCFGASIDYIRKESFNILKPVKERKT
jgi:MoaA/NifB/PqqE/SkfB family radical SAM enzyme